MRKNGRRKVERRILEQDFIAIRDGIEVKLVPAPDGSSDTFILCRSAQRREKEAAIHDRFERKMEEGLARLRLALTSGRLRQRDILQQRLGRLKLECSRVARAYSILVEGEGQSLQLSWSKDAHKAEYLRQTEGAYLLRTNLRGRCEDELWRMYMQLNDAESAFRTLKQGLSIRPIHHQLQDRVNAHVLVCFLVYALYRTLDRISKNKRLGMSPRRVLHELSMLKTGDIILPLTDGRVLRLRRVSRPERKQVELLARLGVKLPERIGIDTFNAPNVVQTQDIR